MQRSWEIKRLVGKHAPFVTPSHWNIRGQNGTVLLGRRIRRRDIIEAKGSQALLNQTTDAHRIRGRTKLQQRANRRLRNEQIVEVIGRVPDTTDETKLILLPHIDLNFRPLAILTHASRDFLEMKSLNK